MPSWIHVCIKQNTGILRRLPLVRGLSADKRLITIAVKLYKTDTLIQFHVVHWQCDTAHPSTPSFVRWGGGHCWQPHRHCGRVQAATRPPYVTPPTPSLQDLRVFTMKSTRTRNLTQCSTPMPIQLQTRWKSVTCFRLFAPPSPPPPSSLHIWTYFWFMLANADWKQC